MSFCFQVAPTGRAGNWKSETKINSPDYAPSALIIYSSHFIPGLTPGIVYHRPFGALFIFIIIP